MKVIKLLQNNDQLITNNMGKEANNKRLTPLTHLSHQVKQVVTVISKRQKISINAIKIPSFFTFQSYIYPSNLLYHLNFHQTKAKRIIKNPTKCCH